MSNPKSINIIEALNKIKEARKVVDTFIQTKPLDATSYFVGKDIVKMSLAFDNEKLALLEYELALAEEFPKHYTAESINKFKDELNKLRHRIELLNKGKFPPYD